MNGRLLKALLAPIAAATAPAAGADPARVQVDKFLKPDELR
jgi:hypothetical protein